MNKLIRIVTILLTTLILCLSVFTMPTFAVTEEISHTNTGEYTIDLNVNPNPITGRTVTDVVLALFADAHALDSSSQFIIFIPKEIVNDNGISFQGGTDGAFTMVSNQLAGDNYEIILAVDVEQVGAQDFKGTFTLQLTTPSITQTKQITMSAQYGHATVSKTMDCVAGAIINSLPVDLSGWTSAGLTTAASDTDFPQYGEFKSILPSPNGDSSAQFENGQSGTMFRMLFNSKNVEQSNAQVQISIPKGWQAIPLSKTNGFPGSVGVVPAADIQNSRIGDNMVRIASMDSLDTGNSSLKYYTNYSNNQAVVNNNNGNGGTIQVQLGTIPAGKSFYIDFGLQYIGNSFTKDVITFTAQSDQQTLTRYLGITFPKMSADSAQLETSSADQKIYNNGTIDLVTKVTILKPVHREELSVMLPLIDDYQFKTVSSVQLNDQESEQVAVVVQNDKLYIKNTVGDLQVNDVVKVSYTLNTQQPMNATVLRLTPKLELSAGYVNGNTIQIQQETFGAQDFSLASGESSIAEIVSASQVASSDSTLAISLASVRTSTGEAIDMGSVSNLHAGNYTVVFQGNASNGKQVETEAAMKITAATIIIPSVIEPEAGLTELIIPSSDGIVVPPAIVPPITTIPQVSNNWDLFANSSMAENDDALFQFYSIDKYFVLRAALLVIVLIPVLLIFLVVRKVKKMSDQSDELIYKREG